MGQLERDAKKLVRELSSDPGYGKFVGWMWGGIFLIGIIGWIVKALVHASIGILAGIGVIVGLVAFIIWLLSTGNRKREKSPRPPRGKFPVLQCITPHLRLCRLTPVRSVSVSYVLSWDYACEHGTVRVDGSRHVQGCHQAKQCEQESQTDGIEGEPEGAD